MITKNNLLYTSLLILIIFASCKDKSEKIHPMIEDISESVYASGNVKTRNQYQVYSTVNGIIQNRLVTEGDLVKQGQPIIKILNETPKLNAENAQLSAEYNDLNANADKLNELKATIDFAKSKKQNDSVMLIRQRNLWAQQVGTQDALEQRELAYKNSTTTYESAVLKYRELKKQLSFAAKQSQKNVQITSTISDDYTITSKINGKVYDILKENGEMVTTQSPVAIIGDADNFYLELQVDEYDIAKIKLGQKTMLTLDSYKGQNFEAVISKIDPIMDEQSRSFTIEATFTKQPQTLYPNLTTEANILIQTKQKVLTIPRNYLIDDTYVMMENKEKRKVNIGLKDYQKAEILSGITADDFIINPKK